MPTNLVGNRILISNRNIFEYALLTDFRTEVGKGYLKSISYEKRLLIDSNPSPVWKLSTQVTIGMCKIESYQSEENSVFIAGLCFRSWVCPAKKRAELCFCSWVCAADTCRRDMKREGVRCR